MDETKYNASHAPDPVAHEANKAADTPPEKVKDAVCIIKRFLKMCNLELVERIKIKDKDTGRIWK